MTESLPPALAKIADAFEYPLVFATLSGAHLYGFPSPDSDYDLRGCHVLPLDEVIGLREVSQTAERLGDEQGLELDLVSHDVKKFCRLLVRSDGPALEQLCSPWVLRTSTWHEEIVALVPGLLTANAGHHYEGFARARWRAFEAKPRVKTLLYVYRALLTGLHVMRANEVEAHLPTLLAHYPQHGVDALIEQKRVGAEKQPLPIESIEEHRAAYERLLVALEAARAASRLPTEAPAFAAIDDWLRRVRRQFDG